MSRTSYYLRAMNSFYLQLKQYFTHNKWFQNLVTWLVLFAVLGLTVQFDSSDTEIAEVGVVLFGLLLMLAIPIYITNLVLLPLYRQGHRWQAIVLYFLCLLLFSFVSTTIVKGMYMIACYFITCSEDLNNFQIGSNANLFGTNLLGTLVGLALRIARDSVIENSKNKEAELQLLKGQLNPHFLFNTLNNLYGLSVIKSDKLPGLMLQLSDLLRYSLYQTKDRHVRLQNEITYLKNYLELERLRLDDEVELRLNIEGQTEGLMIAPMLLIVFVENAFKHFGAPKEQAAYIRVDIQIEDNQLRFVCENSKDPQATTSPREQNTSGIGLTNVRQRLALLYPRQYQLDVQNNTATFKVSLNLDHLGTNTIT